MLSVSLSSAASADDSSWKRAETAHFTIYSDGETDELAEFARDLEKFDGLLRFWFQKPGREGTDKVSIYLMDNQGQVEKLYGARGVAGYYSPDIEGTYAIAHRKNVGGRSLDGQRVLFHEYAHHFMFNEFAVPAPAWLIEGFAEFLATTEFGADGSWTFGKPASHRGRELRYYDDPQIERLLKWPDEERKIITGFYGWSWALTHMLYTDPDRGARISAYINRLSAGDEPIPAAEAVFGDLKKLESALRRHVERKIEFSISNDPFEWSDAVNVQALGQDESRMLVLRLRRRGGADLEDLLAELEALTNDKSFAAEAFAEVALTEIAIEDQKRREHEADHKDEDGYQELGGPWFVKAELAADRAIALDPDHLSANIAKGRILLHRLSKEQREAGHEDWKHARRYLQIANRADPQNAEALYRFANSFVQEKREGTMMFAAFREAYLRAPQVREFRISLAFDLARQGRYDEGISLLKMLANDPHFPERGRKAVKQIELMREQSLKFPPELPDEDDEN